MFAIIRQALEIDPRLVDEPRVINEEVQKEVKRIKKRLEEHSDYAQAYADLLLLAECTTDSLTSFVSRYEVEG